MAHTHVVAIGVGRAASENWNQGRHYPVCQLILFYWRTDSETPAILWGLKQGAADVAGGAIDHRAALRLCVAALTPTHAGRALTPGDMIRL